MRPTCHALGQSYEGGIGGEPWNEAHGGYTFCGLAAAALLGQVRACWQRQAQASRRQAAPPCSNSGSVAALQQPGTVAGRRAASSLRGQRGRHWCGGSTSFAGS